ncbi:MAG: hypothetical protein ACLVJ6_03645 [Merdibacter sp.]
MRVCLAGCGWERAGSCRWKEGDAKEPEEWLGLFVQRSGSGRFRRERQRAVSAALLKERDVLLADEVTASQDEGSAA